MAEPYREVRHAIDNAAAAASIARDVCRILFLAVGNDEQDLDPTDRAALRTVALYGEAKADEANQAADRALMLVPRG